MSCETNCQPSPGLYEDFLFIRLDNPKAHVLFYSFGPDIEHGAWVKRSSAPLPERSHSFMLSSEENYYLLGGTSHNTALSLNDRYEKKTDTWICDTDLPAPMSSAAVAGKFVSGDINHKPCLLKFKNNTWQSHQAPVSTYGHTLNIIDDAIYLTNGKNNNDIYEYAPEKDTWRNVGPNHFNSVHPSSTVHNKKLIFSNKKNGFAEFNPKTETLNWIIDHPFHQGTAIVCSHLHHFVLVGGHGDNIKSDTFFVNLENKTIQADCSVPKSVAYAASYSHSIICGSGMDNAFYQKSCVFDWKEYSEPIKLTQKGSYIIYVVAFDKNYKIIDHRYFKFAIKYKLLAMTLRFSKHISYIRWPEHVKENGLPFTIYDIIPDESTIELSHNGGQWRSYNHKLLNEYISLNKNMIACDIYRFKSSEEKEITLLGHVTP